MKREDRIFSKYAQAREYRAEHGQFEASGIMKGFIVEPYTLNEYTYCFNNPTFLVDRDGAWPKLLEWLMEKDGTSTYGINAYGSIGVFTIDGSIGLSFDYKGNIAVQATGAFGVAAVPSPTGAIAGYHTITNAPGVDYLNEDGGCIGAAIAVPVEGIPLYAGADFVIVGDLSNTLADNQNYYGYTTAAGVGVPGGEAHAEMSYTMTLAKCNAYDILLDLFIRIIECIE